MNSRTEYATQRAVEGGLGSGEVLLPTIVPICTSMPELACSIGVRHGLGTPPCEIDSRALRSAKLRRSRLLLGGAGTSACCRRGIVHIPFIRRLPQIVLRLGRRRHGIFFMDPVIFIRPTTG